MDTEKNIETDENWWASVLADESGQELGKTIELQEKPVEETPEDVWARVQRLYEDDVLVSLQVVGHNRGGVLVEGDGLRGFIPHSHLVGLDDLEDSLERERRLAAYVGEELKLKLIECAPKDDRIVFSERAAQSGAGSRRELFSTLYNGKEVEGEVTNITEFGAFVDLGGVEGLIHISELSWGRVSHPRQIVQMREKIRVQVLELSPERCRVALSLKRLADNPWQNAEEKYQIGQVVPAKITTFLSFGVFARLEEGIEGLIHSSEIPPEKRDLLEEGAKMDVRILKVDAQKQRMGLSLSIEGSDG